MPKSGMRGRDELVALGRITKPHGVRGQFRVLPFNPETEAFAEQKTLGLQSPRTGEVREFDVLDVRRHKGFFLVRLDGVDSLDEAEKLRDWVVVIPQSELGPLEEDEYYYYELEGMSAYTESDEHLGRIEGFIRTAAHDVAVIKGKSGEFMLPWIDGIVLDVDREQGRVVIDSQGGIVKSG